MDGTDDLDAMIATQRHHLLAASAVESDLDLAFRLQIEEALAASLALQPSSSSSPPPADFVVSDDGDGDSLSRLIAIQTLELDRFRQEKQDSAQSRTEHRRVAEDLRRREHDERFARELLAVPNKDWALYGDEIQRPMEVDKDNQGLPFRLYFKGMTSREPLADGKSIVLSAVGAAVCDPNDYLLLKIQKPLPEAESCRELLEAKALIECLNAAISLGIKKVHVFCDHRALLNHKLGSFTEMAFGGRYVILLMALFSIYCGLIYNEFFSVPFHIFGSSAYKCRDLSCSDAHTAGLIKYRDPYPFGVDPRWRGSRSELPFLNSVKMKMSILLGVTQMNLGIMLSYFDAKFHGNSLDIRYQFIPQMIFLNSLFGYLALLIVIKWCTGSQADLYHVMIYMFLSPTDDLGENQLFWGQKQLQILLLLLAVVAVPWMLFPKPFILRKLQTERFQGRTYGLIGMSDLDGDVEPDSARQHHEDFNFSEVFVHQMIHSIEFVLGAVSNTASYLRLWALSLAHSELSTVFYEKILLLAWGYNSIIVRLAGFIVFAFATAFILLMMETLSAFLHALRLHWVEFMNKFYHGDGYKFRPFSFASLADEEA